MKLSERESNLWSSAGALVFGDNESSEVVVFKPLLKLQDHAGVKELWRLPVPLLVDVVVVLLAHLLLAGIVLVVSVDVGVRAVAVKSSFDAGQLNSKSSSNNFFKNHFLFLPVSDFEN